MDPRLLNHYNDELRFIRESAAEFAQEYPKIARRLSLEGLGVGEVCPDPHVERLLEGFAFLTARVQLKLQARVPALSHQLLNVVHPLLLAPLPSATIVELQPAVTEGALQGGYLVPRGAMIQARSLSRAHTPCRFRTAHPVTLRPIEIAEVRYLSGAASLEAAGVDRHALGKAGIRVRIRALPGFSLKGLTLDELTLHLTSAPDVASRLHEQLLSHAIGVCVIAVKTGGVATTVWQGPAPMALGLDDSEAMLPTTRPSFRGYRLLQEYVMLPERFRFLRVPLSLPEEGRENWSALDVVIVLDRSDPVLERSVTAEHLRLHCVPIVNLFRRSTDRLTVDPAKTEQLLVVERNRPLDFEIHSLESVTALCGDNQEKQELRPLYALTHGDTDAASVPFYTLSREPRVELSSRRQYSSRGRYVGTECFIAFSRMDGDAGYASETDVDIEAWCTNRDLPLLLTSNPVTSEFALEVAAPVAAVRCLIEPSFPRRSLVFGDDGLKRDSAWRLISLLSLNHLSLSERGPEEGAEVLRELLALHIEVSDTSLQRQVEGIRRVEYQPIVVRIPGDGPIAFGRGLGVTIHVDEERFEGLGILPIGLVLEDLLARQISINACLQVTLRSTSRGLIKRWPVRTGVLGIL